MVDLNSGPASPTGPAIGERLKIKSFMGRAPAIGVLKTKFLTVLGNSNELLNGISNKLALSISSSDSEYCLYDEEEEAKLRNFDDTIDYTKIDFESRRVKARRAHEEIVSGRYRHPNLVTKPFLGASRHPSPNKIKRSSSHSGASSSSDSSSSSLHSIATNAVERSVVSSTTRSNSLESRNSGGYGRGGRAVPGARRSDMDMQKDLLRVNTKARVPSPHGEIKPQITLDWNEQFADTQNHYTRAPAHRRPSNSSTLTSLRDDPELQVSPSIESSDFKHLFIRSESQNSVPSWASSISLDCHAGEEPIKEFMKRFVEQLFSNPTTLTAELKAEFGALARLDAGRQWFSRFLLDQKAKSKRVDELTFHSLSQYFGIMLFESAECQDFKPAILIMNLCFVFYHEIEVPGCDPYCEYLFTFMRQQPIWNVISFWNTAFSEAVHSEREHRQSLKIKQAEKHEKYKKPEIEAAKLVKQETKIQTQDEIISVHSESSSSKLQNAEGTRNKKDSNKTTEVKDQPKISDGRVQDNIVYRQLAAFTCNMHALGVPQATSLEFFNRQVTTFNLPNDKIKPIRDNMGRMYHETQMWGAQNS